jgi:adenylate cyclase
LSGAPESRRLAALMFTDMVGYTAITQSDEVLALSLLETQSGILLPLIRSHGGTPVKTIGDAHLAEFDSALEAVTCAAEIQRRVSEYGKRAGQAKAFKLRIGIHVGDVIHKSNDVFGDAVNIAARIEPLAEPGGICISQQVFDQVHNKVRYRLEKLPPRHLKNVNMTVEVYRVIEMEPAVDLPEAEMLKERVAVLPLSNFSPNPQDEYLADGMTEELITAISGVQGLRVIARTSVMRFKNTETNISEIGRSLNAGTVLEGSFRKIGERIRVTVQLIDAKTEEHRWASNYDGDMHDIFSIQTDIANKVAEALKAKLVDLPASAPVDIDAYELYLKGRSYWSRRNREGVSRAIAMFKAATERAPAFAKAYAGLADCYLIGRSFQLFPRQKADSEAEMAIQTALRLDPKNVEALTSRGLMLNNSKKYRESEETFRRALVLNPSYSTAHHWYAICLANLGRLEEAAREAALAAQADPLSGPSRNILGVMYIYMREFDKALEVFNDILTLEPGFAQSLNFRSNVYTYKKMEKEALADLVRATEGASEFDRLSSFAYTSAWLGHPDEATRYFEAARRAAPDAESLIPLEALFGACRGDADAFFAGVGQAMENGDLEPEAVRYAWWLDKVRQDPRFAELLKILPA